MPLAHILIVDDDELVRTGLRRALAGLDYVLHFADRPSAGLEILQAQPIDVVISDHDMPGMSGLQFLRVVRQRNPGVVRIMLTGKATLQTAIAAINQDEVFRFLEKPWDDAELNAILLQALERLNRPA